MTTFYDHGGIRITDRWLSIGGRRCRVGHLRNLRTARGHGDRATRRAAGTAVVSLLVVGAAARHVPAPVSVLGAVVLVVLPALVAAARARLVRPAYLLLADYRGTTVRLYATRDETEFGKFSRALARASVEAELADQVAQLDREPGEVGRRALGLAGADPGRRRVLHHGL
ncbi:DUF6232 family protein [Actinoplanes sp. NPDC049668]|uniref:DUF6232 family protein n=1 Tax=Actinoplanes sp. NPDC049668 TaxID=3363904 RepID=UPI003796AEA7